ncbi:MAG: hypothetical protein M0T81_01370 [Thermoplasmatales archaeon]|nr:hypothetical protein [Thermoplasmatales archaeon]
MATAKGKSRKLIVYQDKKSNALFFRSTAFKEGKFRMKDDKFGRAISYNESDETLGKTLRDILKNCD